MDRQRSTPEQTITAGHGDQQIPELGTIIRSQERYGGTGKNEQLSREEDARKAFDLLVTLLRPLTLEQLQEVKTSLESSGYAQDIKNAQVQLVEAIMKWRSSRA